MAKVIEFYVPAGFRRPSRKWIPSEQTGEMILLTASERLLGLYRLLDLKRNGGRQCVATREVRTLER